MINELHAAAHKLADEIWDKNWEHVVGLKSKPVADCEEIINELRARCPGYTVEQYKRAISTAIFEQR